ncbi:hypothetical protein LHJ74_11515 [Streptomyces sp. N2-109]|uniref:Uncharacterized protein n=1 Tax=Streptomyces gossypii TaxID=2883101 RepID=A0ABT2JTD8_9ACTN|nr:hypothetical protein [Streptomyces gossypii]MCT2590529.1 hypothetical protein [Streptomyces gossypii]
MSWQPRIHNGLLVPYIASWTGEETLSAPLVGRFGPLGAFLGYADESPYDRDTYGALWVRQTLAPGKGRPEFACVHALRQRHATGHLLCQVCRTSTLKTNRPQLFLLKDTGHPVGEGERTTAPPVCEPCASVAARDCPHLRSGHVAAWVERSLPWGVAGILHDPETLLPLPGDDLPQIAYTDPRIRWILAARQILSLHGIRATHIRPAAPAYVSLSA